MKNNLRKILPIFILVMISVLALSACQTKTTSPTLTTSTTSNYEAGNLQLVDVLSVQGPLPPINPGGPNVEITLKNVSTEPIVSSYNQAAQLKASDPEILNLRGYAHYSASHFPEAIRDLMRRSGSIQVWPRRTRIVATPSGRLVTGPEPAGFEQAKELESGANGQRKSRRK